MSADSRREPRIGLRNLRPRALIQAATNHQIGLLHSRLQQAVNRDAWMAAIRRTDHGAAEHFREDRRDGGTVNLANRRQIAAGKFLPHLCKLPAGGTFPNTVLSKCTCRILNRDQHVSERFAVGVFQSPEDILIRLPPLDKVIIRRFCRRQQHRYRPQSNTRCRTAQFKVEPPRHFQPFQPVFTCVNQRVLGNRQYRHRREPVSKRFGQCEDQRSVRLLQQRRPGAVIDLDIPPAKLRRDAYRQFAVRGNHRHAHACVFDCFSCLYGDRPRFLGTVRNFKHSDVGKSLAVWRQRTPIRRFFRQTEDVGYRPGALSGHLSSRCNRRNFFTPHSHPVEQKFQVKLWMCFMRARWLGFIGCLVMRTQRVPLHIGHVKIYARQNHRALFQLRYVCQHPGDGFR